MGNEMTYRYEFVVDAEARSFCDEIIDEMTCLGIPQSEAVGRLNRRWRGIDFKQEDVRFHETAEFWAKDIYYGHDSYWWIEPPGLKPTSYP